jgi:hypothetical protein
MNKRNNMVFLDLDSAYYFIESTNLEKKIIENKNENINNLKESINIINCQLDSITSKFLEKLFPEHIEKDNFSFSISLSKYFYKKKDIKKDIERNIDLLYDNRNKITISSTLTLKIELIECIGNILSYIFSRIDKSKIKNKIELRDEIVKVKENKVNVITDFYHYCSVNNLEVENTNKIKYWNQIMKNSTIPPELIFLINLFNSITIFNFDINFENQ